MVLVDTSVWSLALRRDTPPDMPEVALLRDVLVGDGVVLTTGLVLQELLQGLVGPKARKAVMERFSVMPLLQPDREDHVAAAQLRNACCRAGVQLGTIDALLAQLCIRHELHLLSADQDFAHAARHVPLQLLTAA